MESAGIDTRPTARRRAWRVTTASVGTLSRTRLLLGMALSAVIVLVALWLLVLPVSGPPRVSKAETLFLVPSLLCLALPAGSLLGGLLASPRETAVKSLWRPTLEAAAMIGIVTFGLANWLTPRANQRYRVSELARRPAAAPSLKAGSRELRMGELSTHLTELRASGRAAEAIPLAVEWHKKPALAAYCLVLGLAGAAIAMRLRTSVFRWIAGLVILLGVWILLRLAELAAISGSLSPAFAMWGPVMVVGLVALALAQGHRSV